MSPATQIWHPAAFALYYDSQGCGVRLGNMTRGPIIFAWALSLAGLVGLAIWCPPTNVGTTRDQRRDGFCGSAL